MKTDIHPTYFPQAKVVCACGNEFVVGSTVQDLRVELCSKCHPFYTGKQKLIDTSRRVEKFSEKIAAKETMGATVTGKKVKTAKRAAAKEAKKNAKAPATLNEA